MLQLRQPGFIGGSRLRALPRLSASSRSSEPYCARGAAKKPTTARTMHATAPVFTHAHAEPGTSWLTTTVTIERHTAATRNHIARALVLTFLLAWAVGGVCVGADPSSGRALIRVNSASVRAPDLRDPPNFAVSTASLIPATA
jgi:hypothetical protein